MEMPQVDLYSQGRNSVLSDEITLVESHQPCLAIPSAQTWQSLMSCLWMATRRAVLWASFWYRRSALQQEIISANTSSVQCIYKLSFPISVILAALWKGVYLSARSKSQQLLCAAGLPKIMCQPHAEVSNM